MQNKYLIEKIKNADVVVANDLHIGRISCDNDVVQPDDTCIFLCHVNDEGIEYEFEFMPAAIQKALVNFNTITMTDRNGDEVLIKLFKSVPDIIDIV